MRPYTGMTASVTTLNTVCGASAEVIADLPRPADANKENITPAVAGQHAKPKCTPAVATILALTLESCWPTFAKPATITACVVS